MGTQKKRRAILFGIVLVSLALVTFVVLPRRTTELADKTKDDSIRLLARIHATQIDLYFLNRGMPLSGYGKKMVAEAEEHGLDWRLLPAIAVRESSGGLHACGANVFGWASCKRSFKTINEAIATVAEHLGGGNKNTSAYYANKSTAEILNAYNPPTIIPKYTAEVMAIMDRIAPR